jgi:hypothetical protein
MNFKQKYENCKTWHEKVTVMEIYHLTMLHKVKGWTVSQTARDFGVSTGLVSENLRLAKEIHANDKILKCESRQEALRKIK